MAANETLPVSGNNPKMNTGSDQAAARHKTLRKRRIIIFTVATVLNAGLLALLAWQLLTPAQNQSSGGNSSYTPSDPLKGKPAPNFTLAALGTGYGSTISLADFKGKSIVLDFWSSSCGPCQDEAPMLQAMSQKMQAKGVVFIGVDFEDTQTDGSAFLQKYHITYPNAFDPTGSTAINYGVAYTPTTFFINSKGIIVGNIPREMTAQDLQQNLRLLTPKM